MEFSRIEWAGAQELLVKLVQILLPLAQGGEGKGMPSLSQRLYVPPPPSGKENPFPFRVRLLTTLHQAQKQMDHWIEVLSDGRVSEKKGLPIQKEPPLAAKKGEKAVEKNQEQAPSKISVQEGTQKVSPKPSIPIQGQAKKLIEQVRASIQNLASFPSPENPKALPLREAMKKLKPMIDELIEAVSRGDMHSADDGDRPFHTAHARNAVPIPARQQKILDKQFPLPQPGWVREKKPETPQAKTFSSPLRQERGGEERGGPVHQKPEAPRALISKRSDQTDRTVEREARPVESRQEPKPKSKPSSQPGKPGQESKPAGVPPQHSSPQPPANPPYFPNAGGSPSPKEKEKDPPFDRFERIAVPGAPYSSQTPSPIKTKKKRKGFWTRDEEEDEDPRHQR